jgi:tetratricopeptide (TPR) repeat protein
MHVTLDQYLLTLRGELPWELLHQQSHAHLMELCGTCRREWEGAGERRSPFSARLHPPAPAVPETTNRRHVSIWPAAEIKDRIKKRRALARRAREDLARLRRQPAERWPSLVQGSRTRFRSRAFVDLLLEEARACVRSAPLEAAALTALVPLALDLDRRRRPRPWIRVLRARAAAHHANALRVAGELPASQRAFEALHGRLDSQPLLPSDVRAEICSLEASLYTSLRRFGEAEELLDAAMALTESTDSPLGDRLLLKRANLLYNLGRPDEALPLFQHAADRLDPEHEPVLVVSALAGRVSCYCDLDRAQDADRLFGAEGGCFLVCGDDYFGALHGFYRARIDLALDRLAEAEAGFTTVREHLLDLDRDYDAIVASLFLADALLAAGKTAELRHLAAGLVPLFRSRGVEREALASLRLLAEAARTDTLTAALLAQLRHRLHPTDATAT